MTNQILTKKSFIGNWMNQITFFWQNNNRDLCKIMGLDAALFDGVRGSAETIAGLMLENLERLPQRGEALELSNIRLTPQAADKRRILKIKVTKLN